jgi:hypothetical protein
MPKMAPRSVFSPNPKVRANQLVWRDVFMVSVGHVMGQCSTITNMFNEINVS